MTELAKYFSYLDRLRESGKTNMFASSLWLEKHFKLSSKRASEIVGLWMRTFDEGKTAEERAKKC